MNLISSDSGFSNLYGLSETWKNWSDHVWSLCCEGFLKADELNAAGGPKRGSMQHVGFSPCQFHWRHFALRCEIITLPEKGSRFCKSHVGCHVFCRLWALRESQKMRTCSSVTIRGTHRALCGHCCAPAEPQAASPAPASPPHCCCCSEPSGAHFLFSPFCWRCFLPGQWLMQLSAGSAGLAEAAGQSRGQEVQLGQHRLT